MKSPNYVVVTVTALCLICFLSPVVKAQNIVPPSQLPANTPAAYNLIVPVVGQQQSEWCWAACGQMIDNYVDPLPVVQQCMEANAMFNPNGPEPQPPANSGCTTAWSDCCSNGSSCSCDVGDGGPNPQYPFNLYGNSTGSTLTWDQLRYQIWVVNEPFAFGWSWYPCCGAHIQVVTGYETDAQGNQWVYVNNPEPQGQGDFECMSYDEWSQDTGDTPFGSHTHEGDWFDPSYGGTQPQLIFNLPTNGVMPVVGLTEAQAPNLAGTVISDRVAPFATGGLFPTSGQIQERVVQENGSQNLDFYYRVMNSASSPGDITQLTIQNFGRATVAVAYRPDSLGTLPVEQASRDVTGSNVQIYLQPIPPGESSHFILLMTDATASSDQGSMGITTTFEFPWFGITGHAQIATDEPTSVPMTTANMSTCPAMTQPLNQVMANIEAGSAEAERGLPKRLENQAAGSVRKIATTALPRTLSKGAVGAPIQLASVALNELAAYQQGRPIESLVQPLTGLIVPVYFNDENYLGIFLKGRDSHYVPVGMGEPNMTRLIARTIGAVAKQHSVSPESLTVLRVPGLFLTFVARSADGKIRLTPVSTVHTYDLKSGEEASGEEVFARLQPAAQHHHTSGFSVGSRRPRNQVPE
ncbi:MAG: hypothetical protein WCB53_02975 [Terriglobales bacterium]